LHRTFSFVNATRAVASLVYESLGHTLPQGGITLTLKPIVKSRQRKLSNWKSQGEEQASNFVDLDDSGMSVIFPPNTVIIYKGRLTVVEPNHFHMPKARNQVAFDSFFKLEQVLYIFQFTIANNHDIKIGIEESLSGLLNILPPKANWRFVFTTLPGRKIDVEATAEVEKFLEGVTLYSAHVEIE
jgi:hypothetical protein